METIITKTITSTFIDKKSNHSIVKTELTNEILIKSIQEFIITQYEVIFKMIPHSVKEGNKSATKGLFSPICWIFLNHPK